MSASATESRPAAEAVALWRGQNAAWLALRLERLRLLLNRRALWLSRPTGESGAREADWLVAGDLAQAERHFRESDAGSLALSAMVGAADVLIADHERQMRECSGPPALRMLAELADLTPFEEELLLLAAAPALDGAFARAYAELHDDGRRTYATLQLAVGLLVEDSTQRLLAADCLMHARPLRALGLVEVSDDAGEPLVTRRLSVDERVSDYLRGAGHVDARLLPLLAQVRCELSGAAIERAADEVARVIAGQPDRWATVNLVGASDAAAAEVAARSCARFGMGLRALDVGRLALRPQAERSTLLALVGREALLDGFGLMLDTAGVEPRGEVAATVDEVVEHVAATLFVISPERWPGESQAHRDAHVVPVARPTRAEQRALWQSALAPHPHSVNGEVDAIVQQFDLGPAAIAGAVTRARRRAQGDGEIRGPELWRSCREQTGAALDDLARRITPGAGWDDLVVRDDVRAQLGELASQVALRGRVYEGWGFGARLIRGRGISALFAGASGTGKTMAAEVLAARLELDLYRVDLAGVVSKYIGETEKSLRRVFDAAQASGAILFFDEADALFGSRTEVRDSHDRYANVEVNYLLQRMEDYPGLAILATNRRDALDGAFLRRLRFVIDFPFPAAQERRRIWEGAFPPEAALRDVEYSFLSRLELTGGSIRSIAVNAAFLAAGEDASIGMAQIVRAAAREYAKLSKPIGAAEFGAYHALARQ